ncbi:DUF2283 domain-containing protein [Candidatus Poriferisodalis sp.]|uniref:DUF2283 domain-containing protein n=1 Tax=Candidatus Poriferisodalis sp. TaxID=3101277 RepID=UPI003B5216F8
MRLRFNKEDDALYFRLDESAVVDTLEVAPGVILDFNCAEQVVGIEMLNVSSRSADLNLDASQSETA